MNKSFTKYLLFYLLTRVILRALLSYIFPEIWFSQFCQNHRLYLIILSISYFFYCYYLDETEKKFEYLRNTLFIVNTYITLHIFFRPLLNIPSALFLVLGVILLLMRYIKNLHIKRKQILYLIGGVFSFLILISGLFYLYPDAPDTQGFIDKQKTQFLIHSPTNIKKQQAYLQIIDLQNSRTQERLFNNWTSLHNLPHSYQINYISTTTNNNFEAFIIFPNGSLLQILPQSIIQKDNSREYQSTNIKTFSAPRKNQTETYLPSAENLLEIWTEQYREISDFYRENFETHLTQQMGGIIRTNSTIQKINQSVLSLLHRMFPGFFWQNIKNYQDFQYYFELFDNQEIIIDSSKYARSRQIQYQSNLFQQISNNIKISLPFLKSF